MAQPFRYDSSLVDFDGPIKAASPKLTNAQLESRRAQQRAYAKRKRATDRAWVERRNAAQRKLRAKAPSLKDESPNDPRNPAEHGTVQRYRRYKCKCPRCTMANRDAMRMYRTGSFGPEENLR